jgi:hypothetical protein
MSYLVNNVEALYPRINRTYRFDNTENRSVPCDPLDDGAAYEMQFRMTKDQAKELFTSMAKAYAEKREDKWPEKLDMPFKKDEDGMYIGKAKLKGAYSGEPTNAPLQVDAKGKELPSDFLLTTGSTVNLAVMFTPYNMRDHGVSIRLNGVQVVKYVEMKKRNPFGEVDGFSQDEESGNPFTAVEEAPVKEAVNDDTVFEDEAEEPPKKKPAKKKAAAKPKEEDLASIMDAWDDE